MKIFPGKNTISNKKSSKLINGGGGLKKFQKLTTGNKSGGGGYSVRKSVHCQAYRVAIFITDGI